MTKLKQIARHIRRYLEALAYAVDYDPLSQITERVERLERIVADLGKAPERSS
ncbi:MAG: hypothetical protein J7485_09505 [Sphingobium sp.]|nr:hypothetical protein [Sphingobium sp.]